MQMGRYVNTLNEPSDWAYKIHYIIWTVDETVFFPQIKERIVSMGQC